MAVLQAWLCVLLIPATCILSSRHGLKSTRLLLLSGIAPLEYLRVFEPSGSNSVLPYLTLNTYPPFCDVPLPSLRNRERCTGAQWRGHPGSPDRASSMSQLIGGEFTYEHNFGEISALRVGAKRCSHTVAR
jgi:hypothetical protein